MREILFRGKRKDNREWLYWDCFGRLVCDDDKTFNFVNYKGKAYWYIVDLIPILDLDTVGEYTGLTDRNGKKIFKGDIVRYYSDARMYMPTVDGGWSLKGDSHLEERTQVNWSDDLASFMIHGDMRLSDQNSIAEVIGNIHDNPELLEVQNENSRY